MFENQGNDGSVIKAVSKLQKISKNSFDLLILKNNGIKYFRSIKGIPYAIHHCKVSKNTIITLYILLLCNKYHTVTLQVQKPTKSEVFWLILRFMSVHDDINQNSLFLTADINYV